MSKQAFLQAARRGLLAHLGAFLWAGSAFRATAAAAVKPAPRREASPLLDPGTWVGEAEPEATQAGVYAVTEACIRCKYQECAEVCPTEAFREGASMLVIDPDDCIDCGVCEAECPVGAIYPVPPTSAPAALNRKYARVWPVIAEKGRVPPDARRWEKVRDKARLFDPRPAPRRAP